MNSDEVRIIGRFIPTEFTPEVIQAELRPMLPRCCQSENIGVRIPQGIEPPYDNLQWHHDGMPAYHMVVWASEMPTEVRDSAGNELQAQPFDIIWFDNVKAEHRQPANTRSDHRWFVAVRCSGAIF